MTCEKCGSELAVGDWPFCPHGDVHWAVHGDECDYVDENLGPEPIRIRSWSERRRLMKQQGLVDAPWYGPQSNTTRWDNCADEYTLRTKGELLLRAMKNPQPADDDAQMASFDTHTMSKEELKRYGVG